MKEKTLAALTADKMASSPALGEGQAMWFALVEQRGEPEARAYLARRFREAADRVEAKGYPDVLGCIVPDHAEGIARGGDFIETVSVTLTQLWPG